MTPYLIVAILMASSASAADLFPGGLFPGGLFPQGVFPNGINMNFPPIPPIPPMPPIVIPPIPPMPPMNFPTAEDIANQKPAPGEDFSGVSVNTINGVTYVVENKNGVVKKYKIDANSPKGQKYGSTQTSNVVVSNTNPSGFYQQSSMTFVGGNGGGVANFMQNVDGQVTHDVVNFGNKK